MGLRDYAMFFGAARPGEVLSCSRADLLLPADLMEETHGSA